VIQVAMPQDIILNGAPGGVSWVRLADGPSASTRWMLRWCPGHRGDRDTTFSRDLSRSGPTSGWDDLSIGVPGLLRLEANHAFDVADRALAGDALADAAVAEHGVHADDAAGAADHARQVLVVETAQCLLREHELLGLLVHLFSLVADR